MAVQEPPKTELAAAPARVQTQALKQPARMAEFVHQRADQVLGKSVPAAAPIQVRSEEPAEPTDGGPNEAGAARSPEGAPQSARDAYISLIRQDIAIAYDGRPVSEKDLNYWLPKLEGGCDAAEVRSGQMTSTEYWHRRLLGWRAGGQDMATSGPYAGSSEARGPVPSAAEVVKGIPPGKVIQPGGEAGQDFAGYQFGEGGPSAETLIGMADPQMLVAFRALIEKDFQTAYLRKPTEKEMTYWLGLMLGKNDSSLVTGGQMNATEYWHRRLLGWQAGGQDQAVAGPYARGAEASGPVPSACQLVPNLPPKGILQ
ncbi:MAG: hypothetical protein U0931_04480 [Vulcanimicrobiota bacterium]